MHFIRSVKRGSRYSSLLFLDFEHPNIFFLLSLERTDYWLEKFYDIYKNKRKQQVTVFFVCNNKNNL